MHVLDGWEKHIDAEIVDTIPQVLLSRSAVLPGRSCRVVSSPPPLRLSLKVTNLVKVEEHRRGEDDY